MSRLTLTLRERLSHSLDMTGICPDQLHSLTEPEIAALPLSQGPETLCLGDLFSISGQVAETVVIANACERLYRIGAGMQHGTLLIEGDAGAYLGQAMRGGTLVVNGNSGDAVGAPGVGERIGMRGGLILIKGNAGERLGERQRRGVILVEGAVGRHCGRRMIAGTIAVLGEVQPGLGAGMRRGSILLARADASILPLSFNDNGSHTLNFLPLFWNSLRALNSRFGNLSNFNRARRWLGDQANQGLGEILFSHSQ